MGGLSDLVRVVNESAAVNTTQPTALEDGSVIVNAYSWQEYFANYCTKVVGIKKLHHIRVDSTHPVHICEGEVWFNGREKMYPEG